MDGNRRPRLPADPAHGARRPRGSGLPQETTGGHSGETPPAAGYRTGRSRSRRPRGRRARSFPASRRSLLVRERHHSRAAGPHDSLPGRVRPSRRIPHPCRILPRRRPAPPPQQGDIASATPERRIAAMRIASTARWIFISYLFTRHPCLLESHICHNVGADVNDKDIRAKASPPQAVIVFTPH